MCFLISALFINSFTFPWSDPFSHFLFLTVLLRYNLHTIKFTHLKQKYSMFFGVFTQLCNHYYNLILEHSLHPTKTLCTKPPVFFAWTITVASCMVVLLLPLPFYSLFLTQKPKWAIQNLLIIISDLVSSSPISSPQSPLAHCILTTVAFLLFLDYAKHTPTQGLCPCCSLYPLCIFSRCLYDSPPSKWFWSSVRYGNHPIIDKWSPIFFLWDFTFGNWQRLLIFTYLNFQTLGVKTDYLPCVRHNC